MTIHSIGEFHPAPNRPGILTRPLIATEHGFTSFFVGEFEMDEGASIPLHNDPTRRGNRHGEGGLRRSDSAGPATRASQPGAGFGSGALRSGLESSRLLPGGYHLSGRRCTDRLKLTIRSSQ
jgi:hypothetical protein